MPPREKPEKTPILCEHRIPDTSYCARCAAAKKPAKPKKGKRESR